MYKEKHIYTEQLKRFGTATNYNDDGSVIY